MFAIGLNHFGGPEVLHRVELPDPHPAAGEVRIRVHAAAINPVDVMIRDGSLAQMLAGAPPPCIPGMDVSGTIDEVGAGVDGSGGLRVGMDVVGIVNNPGNHGGYSELVCLPAASVAAMPAGTRFPQAASFLMNALTARSALGSRPVSAAGGRRIPCRARVGGPPTFR